MRIWHQSLIPHLDRQRLLGLNRELAALLGLAHGRKHSTVDWAFAYNPYRLYAYHQLVRQEMRNRGYKPSPDWEDMFYRGKRAEPWTADQITPEPLSTPIFPEHNEEYLQNEIQLLAQKGVDITVITAAFPPTRRKQA